MNFEDVCKVSQNLDQWEDIMDTWTVVDIKTHSPEAKGLKSWRMFLCLNL